MRRGPSQENHEGLGTARCASLRARGSPKGAGAVKVGAAQQGPARPTHLAVSHPEVKRAARNGNQTPTSRPVGRSNPAPAPGRPPGAGDTGAHCRRPGAGGLPAPPRRPPRTANRPCGPRAPTRPARGPRALPPHLPPPGLSGRPTGTQGRGEKAKRRASPPGRLSPVAGRGASRRASPRPRPAPPACHLRVARAGAGPHAGSVRARSAGARAARRPRSRPRARAGERGL